MVIVQYCISAFVTPYHFAYSNSSKSKCISSYYGIGNITFLSTHSVFRICVKKIMKLIFFFPSQISLSYGDMTAKASLKAALGICDWGRVGEESPSLSLS